MSKENIILVDFGANKGLAVATAFGVFIHGYAYFLVIIENISP